MSGIESWSQTPASNNQAPPFGWPAGILPNQVEPIGRQMMASLAFWYQSAEWINYNYTPTYVSATQFTIPGNVTAIFHVGRRVQGTDGVSPVYGAITASAFTTLTTVTVAWDSGVLATGVNIVYVGINSKINTSVPVNSVFNAGITVSAASGIAATISAVPSQYGLIVNSNNKAGIEIIGSAGASTGIDLIDGGAGTQIWSVSSGYPSVGSFGISTTAGATAFAITSAKVCQIADDGGTLQVAGYRGTPIDTLSSLPYTLVFGDRGRNKKITAASGTLTVPANIFSAGDVVVISAFSGTNTFTIAQGASMNMYLGGSGLTTGNRTLASVGMVTIEFLDATNCIIQGSGLS